MTTDEERTAIRSVVSRLLNAPPTHNAADEDAACIRFRELGPEGPRGLFVLLQLAVATRHLINIALSISLFPAFAWVVAMMLRLSGLAALPTVLLFVVAAGLVISTIAAFCGRWTPAQRRAATLLGAIEGRDSIPVLIEALSTARGNDAILARGTLTRLLPLVGPEDADMCTARQRALLCKSIGRYGRDLPYVRAALHALGFMGGRADLPLLRPLANSQSFGTITSDFDDSLERIEARATEREVRDYLLRPSMRTDESSTLLHPVAAGNEAVPAHLLRASRKDE